VQRLYNEIREACEKSRESKHKLRMLLNSDELQPYLQHAFDHFCRNLERPFDFVQASQAFHPIPSNFGGNILKMAINIMEVWRNSLDGPSIFKELSFLVASCIMLDSARRRNLGTFEKVFGGYVHHCDDVLESFCNLHWPCEYVHPNTSGRCVNVRAGHQSKGHQLDNGKVMAVGDYQSDFTVDRYRLFFEYAVAYNLRDLLQRLQFATQGSLHLRQDELSKAAEIHKGVVLGPFFRHLSGAKRFVNHTACYCCLTCPPEHPLPCGHVLCTPCIQAYGQARGAFMIEMTECPMHHDHADGQFRLRWPVFIKPPGAGVRVLALDGGGIRGIVELTILQHVETQLGAGLPIQAFFDLMVGTSAGGIIALGLGANGWSVAKCTSMFKKLCKQSFERKWAFSLHALEQLMPFSGRALYETSSIENALQQAFGADQSLFAGTRELMDNEAVIQRTTKVAVTTTTTGGRPALLGNYNRTDIEDDAPYSFPRSEKPDSELKVNEAARATSAAPTIFKQFEHKPSGQVYLDGAIHFNCPVGPALREQKLIWPENADRCPDIVLSIGTGYNIIPRKPVGPANISPRGLFAGVRILYKTAVDNISTSLNAEKMWREFLDHSQVPEHLKERYVRLNLKLQKDPPRMDEVSQLEEMEAKTRSQYTKDRALTKAVADRLLATAFYFALEQEILPPSRSEVEPTCRTVTGRFECRFAPHSSELKSLGETLRRRSRDAHRQLRAEHNPYFVICERRDGLDKSAQHVLEPDIIDRMINEGIFAMNRIKVTLSSRRAETEMFFCLGDQPKDVIWYPISGFPRFLIDELDSGECLLNVLTNLSTDSIPRSESPAEQLFPHRKASSV
jgi:predicted acylesterase/phospholipase RssA